MGLGEIVSFTARGNTRSRRVMERLAMHHNPGDDFEHPRVDRRSDLRHHVLYRLARDAWVTGRGVNAPALSRRGSRPSSG